MKRIKMSTAQRNIKDGRFECVNNLRIGYVEIRWHTGKKETVEVIEG